MLCIGCVSPFRIPDKVSGMQPESVYGSFVPDFKEYHESIDGRVKLIHEFFIQIGKDKSSPLLVLQFLIVPDI